MCLLVFIYVILTVQPAFLTINYYIIIMMFGRDSLQRLTLGAGLDHMTDTIIHIQREVIPIEDVCELSSSWMAQLQMERCN